MPSQIHIVVTPKSSVNARTNKSRTKTLSVDLNSTHDDKIEVDSSAREMQ